MIALLFPLAASLFYVVGAMYAKRSSDLGGGIWQNSFVANIITALLFSSLWVLGGEFPGWSLLYQPALVAMLFIISQALMFLSLDKGDVSIATPVLGTKIIVVAVFQSVLTNDPVSPKLWIAAILATLAVVILNSSGGGEHRRVGFTIVTSFFCGVGFALFDVLVQNFSPNWGGRALSSHSLFLCGLFQSRLYSFFQGDF